MENLAVTGEHGAGPAGGSAAAAAPNLFFPRAAFWAGRRVVVTGHTGFKGSWLCAWLADMGAKVTGYALAPVTEPNMFDGIGLGARMNGIVGDIRDYGQLENALAAAQPEFIFHLAAQSLVRESYVSPLETFDTNAQGTANLLDIGRNLASLRSIVVVSSDKCYRNASTGRAFVEDDPLGGRDPYSASKACTEIVTAAFRDSFYRGRAGDPPRAAVASARAGNVIGGGDWARDRIVPDLVRAYTEGRSAVIRNPQAVRPWQHVLDPVAGYLSLAQASCSAGEAYASAFNFGPDAGNSATVASVVDGFARIWGSRLRWEHRPDPSAPYEASTLALDASKAQRSLGWRPLLDLDRAIAMTAAWYDAFFGERDVAAITADQITAYAAATLPA